MLRKTIIAPNIKADALITNPVIVRVNDFDEKSLKNFNESFQYAVDAGQEIIPIWIDSFGGQVYSLLGMLETINSSPVPVATYVSSKAMSCGAVLLSAGTEGYRFIAPGAHVLVHQVSSAAWGKTEDIAVSSANTIALNKQLLSTMSKNCGKPADYFHDFNNGNADLYFNAKKTVKHGLANHIASPTMTVKVMQKVALTW